MLCGVKEIDLKYYLELQQDEIPLSKIPTGIVNSHVFKNLVDSNIIQIVKNGRGKIARVKNPESYQKFITTYFPQQMDGSSRSANIARFRNSKATGRIGSNISFLRGKTNIQVNGIAIDLAEYTDKFGLFSAYNPEISVSKLCFIENLEVFLFAETILDPSYTYLHKYGRVGKEFLTRIKASEVLVFPDYDLVGLHEYLVIQKAFPSATLFLPDNFEDLFKSFAAILPEKQIASSAVKNSVNPLIIKIREMVLKSNRFLEQEILLLAR